MNIIKEIVMYHRAKVAVTKAKKYAELTGKKMIVLQQGSRFVVKSKKALKHLIKTGKIKADIQTLEECALYVSN
jgi:hypothetical protein